MAIGSQANTQLLYALVNNQLATDKYFCDRFDEDTTKYYGFLTKGGYFYIMKEEVTGTVHLFTYYVADIAEQSFEAYETAWTGRAALDYTNIVVASSKLQ